MVHKLKKINVGDLGEAIISPKGFIDVTYVREGDGTKSWQLLPDENSDTFLKSAKVIPLELEKEDLETLTKEQKKLIKKVSGEV
jgi:hypothetical protein